jgi:hypothetical protein
MSPGYSSSNEIHFRVSFTFPHFDVSVSSGKNYATATSGAPGPGPSFDLAEI